jgi:tryptophan synthase alpha chain
LDASGSGFLYYVSVLGVTGARENLPENLAIKCDEIRSMVHLPLAVGFGISGPAQAAALRDRVDAVVVGSAIVSMIQRGVWNPTQWVAEMKRALMR